MESLQMTWATMMYNEWRWSSRIFSYPRCLLIRKNLDNSTLKVKHYLCSSMGQINQNPRFKYWATRSSVCSFAHSAHSGSALLALLARSAALIGSLAGSLIHPRAREKVNDYRWDIGLFLTIVTCDSSQVRQFMQESTMQPTPTWSPALTPETWMPTSVTKPASSWPGTCIQKENKHDEPYCSAGMWAGSFFFLSFSFSRSFFRSVVLSFLIQSLLSLLLSWYNPFFLCCFPGILLTFFVAFLV